MPTYEYRCQDCGATVEVVQSFKDEPLTVCGVCGGRLRRVFHPVGIVLKGSGFYSTDNRSGKKPATTAPKDKDKDKDAAASKPKDDKPAATTTKTEKKSDSGGSGGSSGSSARAS